MPTYQTKISTRDRFQIWLANPAIDATSWRRSKRIKLLNFRRQEKALGAANAEFLQYDDEVVSEYEFSNNGLLKEGIFVKIVDSLLVDSSLQHSDLDPVEYFEAVVFWGYIDSITSDVFEDITSSTGTIGINEIGWKLDKKPCVNYFDEYGQTLKSPPDFNASINDKIFGNRINDNKFIADPDKYVISDTKREWPSGYDETKVWTVKAILELLVLSSNLGLSVEIQDKVDGESTAIPPYFTATTPPRTYPSYKDKSIMKAIDDLVIDPMGWVLDYRSSSGGVIVKIYTKVNKELDDYPSPNYVTINLNETPRATNLNVTDIEDKADKVTIRGDNILCCGSFVPWTDKAQNNCEKDWTDSLETLYVEGTGVSGLKATDAKEGDKWRTTIPGVYRKFKISTKKDVNNRDVITVPESPGIVIGGVNDQTHYPLCPHFKFIDDEGAILETPVVEKDFEETSIQHHTPNPLKMKWSKKLPIYTDRTVVTSTGEESLISNILLDPMAIVPTMDDSRLLARNIWYQDTVAAGQFGNKIRTKLNFTGREISLDVLPAAQAFAWDESAIWEGGTAMNNNAWAVGAAGASNYNPNEGTGLPQTGAKSHWGRFIFVGALYSDQKLEISKAKTYITDDGEGGTIEVEITNPLNHVIIEDPSLGIWFCHKNTPNDFDYNYANNSGTMDRFSDDTFTRNDLPIAKKLMEATFEWLSINKKAIHLEFPLMNYREATETSVADVTPSIADLDIGTCVRSIVDIGGVNNYAVNTAVSSINYDLTEGSPRISIHTSIPKMSGLKRQAYSKQSSNNTGVSFESSRNYKQKIEVENDQIKPEPIETLSIGVENFQSEGGSGSTTPIAITYTAGVTGDNDYVVYNAVKKGYVWDTDKTALANLTDGKSGHSIGLVISEPVTAWAHGITGNVQTTFTVLAEGIYNASSVADDIVSSFDNYPTSGENLKWNPEGYNYLSPETDGIRVPKVSGGPNTAGYRMRLYKNHKSNLINWKPQKQRRVEYCNLTNTSTITDWVNVD